MPGAGYYIRMCFGSLLRRVTCDRFQFKRNIEDFNNDLGNCREFLREASADQAVDQAGQREDSMRNG